MKNKVYITIVFILTILSFIIGFSYAYFSTIITGNDTVSTHSQTMGTLQLTFNGTNNINLGNAQPGDNQTKIFTVKNTGTLPVDNYEIYFSNVINTLEKKKKLYIH